MSINEGKRVTLLCGVGCREAKDEVLALSERLKAPIAHTLRAKDIFDYYDDPNVVGMTGLIGNPAGYHAVWDSDVLVMLGTGFPVALLAALFRELDDEDRVLGAEAADQRHQPDLAVHIEIKAAQEQRNDGANQPQRHGQEDHDGHGPALVLGGEHKEDEDQRQGILLLGDCTTHFSGDNGKQRLPMRLG